MQTYVWLQLYVAVCLKSCHLSAPGPDGITYKKIKICPQILWKTCSISIIFFEHVFPVAWHDGIVIPLPKSGKDAADPKNYRLIALTSCRCKIMEKMINNRLVFILDRRKLISPWQSGFRHGRSTTDNFTLLYSTLHCTALHCTAIYVDYTEHSEIVMHFCHVWKYVTYKIWCEFRLWLVYRTTQNSSDMNDCAWKWM